jgi:hypothetical protein
VWAVNPTDSVTNDVWSRSSDAVQGLMTLRAVEDAAMIESGLCHIAITADSTTHLLCGHGGAVWYKSAAQGAAFDAAPVRMDTVTAGTSHAMALELRPDGSGVAVYSDGTPLTIHARLRSANGEWTEPVPVLVPNTNEWNVPAVALGLNGEIMLAIGEYNALRAVHYRPEAGWGTPMTVFGMRSDVTTPDLAADGSGNFFVAWTHAGDTNTAYASRFNRSSRAWASPTTLQANSGFIKTIRVAASGAGDAMVIWPGGGASMRLRRYLAGSGWQADTIVLAGSNIQAADIAMSSHGNAMVMYTYYTQSGEDVVHTLIATPFE